MEERINDSKRWIRCLIAGIIVILLAISYYPVKIAVYADKDDEKRFSKQGVFKWYNKVWEDHMECILKTSSLTDRPKLKWFGVNYIGESEVSKLPVYFEAQKHETREGKIHGKSPLLELNSNFDPGKTENYFAITYEGAYWIEGEEKEDYYIVPIVIYNWTPVYPIQRSGTLARLLLPKGYLTIWDFIGKSAMNTGD